VEGSGVWIASAGSLTKASRSFSWPLTNCTAQEVIHSVNEVQHIVTTLPINSVRTLSDLNGGRDAVTRIKEVAVLDRPHVSRAALVGADSLPQVFYDALKTFSRREFPRFKTREEAMDWLVTG
jgi:hypothetical protein